jgi:Fic family protein
MWGSMGLVVEGKSPLGQFVSERNRARQFDFLQTSFVISENADGLEIDHEFVCTLNAYAARYLSMQPGRYRRHYNVVVGKHTPSDWSLAYEEMDGFLEILHKNWAKWEPTEAAAYTLWAINHVHPFCEGNGRTARALCYYVLCKKFRKWLPGRTTILELMRTANRQDYCDILNRMDAARLRPAMETDLSEMTAFIDKMVVEQLRIAQEDAAAQAAGAANDS